MIHSGSNGLRAGVETGGTKTVVAGLYADASSNSSEGELAFRESVHTTSPRDTLDAVTAILDRHGGGRPYLSLGIGTFGPVRVDAAAADYGRILATPKPGWTDTDLVRHFDGLAHGSVVVDTDVNAAALAEATAWGKRGTLAYVTVGTGVGLGVVRAGRVCHGDTHFEAGHVPVPRAPDDGVASVCPFHANCIEGMASGPSWIARYGCTLSELPLEHGGQAEAAFYLARFCQAVLLMHSPSRVVLGGGVMKTPGLLDRVRAELIQGLGGYGPYADTSAFELVAPLCGDDAGVRGAIALGALSRVEANL